jgi:hypothetical protein
MLLSTVALFSYPFGALKSINSIWHHFFFLGIENFLNSQNGDITNLGNYEKIRADYCDRG